MRFWRRHFKRSNYDRKAKKIHVKAELEGKCNAKELDADITLLQAGATFIVIDDAKWPFAATTAAIHKNIYGFEFSDGTNTW